jgi:hypothetical protein
MKREDINRQIEALECMRDIAAAIEDVETTEFEPGDDGLFGLSVKVGDNAVSFVHGLPPKVLLAGLRSMEGELVRAVQLMVAQEVAA